MEFWRIAVRNVILIFPKIPDMFFKVKYLVGHISLMADRLACNETQVRRLGVKSNFDSTHDLDLGFLKLKLWNSCISEIIGLGDVKWNESKPSARCTGYVPLPFDHTHAWKSLISGMTWPIGMERKGRVSIMYGHEYDFALPLWGSWMYHRETEVTWGVGVQSTHSRACKSPCHCRDNEFEEVFLTTNAFCMEFSDLFNSTGMEGVELMSEMWNWRKLCGA